MNTMIAAILVTVLQSRGIPAKQVENLVIIEGRACTAQALHNDPTRPVLVCK